MPGSVTHHHATFEAAGPPRVGLTQSLSTAALGWLFGIGFALEQFRRDLDDLIERSREISGSHNEPVRAR